VARARGGRRAALLALALAASTLGAPAAAAAVPTTADAFLLDGTDGHLGQGLRWDLTDADASFWIGRDLLSGNGVLVSLGTGETDWRLRFVPPQGQTLQVGHYADAGVQTPLTADLLITRESSGCNRPTGSFTIHEISFDGAGEPQVLAASFEHWCDPLSGSPIVGLVRVNSNAPVALLSTPATSRGFGSVTAGETGALRTYTLEAFGELPVTVTDVDVSGKNPLDFPLSSDGCSGVTLDSGETCTFMLRFTPKATGERTAQLRISNTAPEGTRVLALGGYGRIPTSMAAGVRPDSDWFNPSIFIIATPTPAEAGEISVECVLDGAVAGAFHNAHTGLIGCLFPRSVGTHTASTRYVANYWYGGSTSPPITFSVSQTTAVNLSASKTTVPAGVPVALTATVSTASNLLYPGGDLVLRDATTNAVLGTTPIDYGAETLAVSVGFAAGTHTIVAEYEGVAGVLNGSVGGLVLNVQPDSIDPTATAPKERFKPGVVQTASGALPVELTWSGADNLSGIKRYDIARQVDGGTWTTVGAVSTARYLANLAQGHSYRFRIRPVDYAGNVGGWKYGATFTVKRYAEYTARAAYLGTWTKVVGGSWSGGTAWWSSTAGAKVRFTFTGRSFAWLTLKAPTRGQARIYVNGSFVATVDLWAATTQAQVVGWARNWTTTATRTVEIRIVGTNGRPRIDVDGFWVRG
jgi:hypothetical protein